MKLVFSAQARPWSMQLKPEFWTKRNLLVLALTLVAFVAFGAYAGSASAQAPAIGIFDEILNEYVRRAQTWEDRLRSIALGLFGGLAVISIAWTFIKIALQKDDFKDLVPAMTMQILTLGFFLFLVEQGTWVAQMLLQSFMQAGRSVGGVGELTPSWVVVNGFDTCFATIEKLSDYAWNDMLIFGLPVAFCAIAILVAFVLIAVLLMVTIVEAYFVMYAGIIMLGFGALPWTREIPKNYLIYAINVGVKLFVLYLIVGIGIDLSSTWADAIQGTDQRGLIKTILLQLGGAIFFLTVSWKIPGIAAALSSGSINFNASDAVGVGAAAAAGGAAMVGAGVLAGGAIKAASAGATQAVSAGTALAREQGASGMSAALKGIANAGGAAASETASAAKASFGFAPPSGASEDARGRSVGNLGTRAANNLSSQLQETRESKAAAPHVGGEKGVSDNTGHGASGSGAGAAQGAGAAATQGAGGESSPAIAAAEAVNQAGAAEASAISNESPSAASPAIDGAAPGTDSGSNGVAGNGPGGSPAADAWSAPSASPSGDPAPPAAAAPSTSGGSAGQPPAAPSASSSAGTATPAGTPAAKQGPPPPEFKSQEVSKGGLGPKQPPLPPDAGQGGVSINMRDEDA